MRSLILAASAALLAAFALFACGSDDKPSTGSPDASAFDVSSPGIDSGSPDPGTDAGNLPDTGAADGGADAGPHGLFAHINQTLVSVNPSTGAVTDIGPTGNAWI